MNNFPRKETPSLTSSSSIDITASGNSDVGNIKSFAEKCNSLRTIFLNPTVGHFLKAEVPDKRILDIGCGTGYWCCQAAQYGAKSVYGFDREETTVELAKQATLEYQAVNIRRGDITNMPYEDNSFDIALSIHVTNVLPIQILVKHFKELHRVLVPGGKALVLNLSNSAFQTILTDGASKAIIQDKIDQILNCIPDQPSLQQMNNALKDLRGVVCTCFAYDANGSLFHVKDANQLANGQAVMRKTYIATFSDFYYNDQFLIDQTTAAGLSIDCIENMFTEERRIKHNIVNPEVAFNKNIVDHPLYLLHHISKPFL